MNTRILYPFVVLLTIVVGATAWEWFERITSPPRTASQPSPPPSVPASPYLVIAGPTMGARYSVSIHEAPESATAESLRPGIEAILNRIDRAMSTYRDDSELSRFNASRSTDWFPVSADTARVVADALEVSRISDGAFDVTVLPLVRLWGFGKDRRLDALPTEAAIDAARADVGWQYLEVRSDPPALRKSRPGVQADLSGIAPGYAADGVAAHLDGLGLRHYLVDVGGELKARGLSAERRAWRIGIEEPVVGHREIRCRVELAGAALATSGNYRNFHEVDGHHYSHIIDPRTGRPIGHTLASASIIHPSAMRADALATALMVFGPEAAHSFAEKHRLPVLLIAEKPTGRVSTSTPAFDAVVLPTHH